MGETTLKTKTIQQISERKHIWIHQLRPRESMVYIICINDLPYSLNSIDGLVIDSILTDTNFIGHFRVCIMLKEMPQISLAFLVIDA